MPRTTLRLCLVLLPCCAAYGQPAGNALTFEVASVKPSPPLDPTKPIFVGCKGGPGSKDAPGRWTCQNMTVSNLVSTAWNLKPYQLSSQSNLFEDPRYEIAARLPPGTTYEQFQVMLQNLLKERFKLAVHFERKEAPGFELVVAKGGPKLKPAEPKQDDAENPPLPPGPPQKDKEGFPVLPRGTRGAMIGMDGKNRWASSEATMEQIALLLDGQLSRPVVDATGLSGKYDVTLSWVSDSLGMQATPDNPAAPAPVESGPRLTSAIQDQLGLRLQSKKVPVDVLVIDHVEKTPTEN